MQPLIKAFEGVIPDINPSSRIAPNATLIGKLTIGADSSVWYNCVLRGDVEAIKIGERTNIQDHSILHCTTGRSPVTIGNDVTVGHRAIIHGCTIDDECLIGMGAIILDDAHVPKHTVVAAAALVREGSKLESGFLYAGVPARKIKAISPEQIALLKLSAAHYVHNSSQQLIAGSELQYR